MDIQTSAKVCFKKFATFEGRASRSEFWWFMLVYFILSYTVIGGLACIIPAIAVTTRRLHDVGRSGWLQLWAFVPFAYYYVLYLCYLEGDKEANQYGEVPQD